MLCFILLFSLIALTLGYVPNSKRSYVYATAGNPSYKSVPNVLGPRSEAIQANFLRDMKIQLAKRESVAYCGVFEVTFMDPEPDDDFKIAACYAMREVISSRFNESFYEPLNRIRVEAYFGVLDPGVLGGAGPNAFCNQGGILRPASYYRLLSSLCVATLEYDIGMIFTTSSSINWYLGIDGNTPNGAYDFVTVVAHEIGHGIGFVSGVDVGPPPSYFGSPNMLFYDTLLNPPVDMGNLLSWATNDVDMEFNPFQATGNAYPDEAIYTPSSAQSGSSVSHWDQNIYLTAPPTCDNLGFPFCNSLMRPQLPDGLAIHRLGGNTINYLDNLGYEMFDCTLMTTKDECIGDPETTGARCDWCESNNSCNLINMIDYIWTTACPDNNFTTAVDGTNTQTGNLPTSMSTGSDASSSASLFISEIF